MPVAPVPVEKQQYTGRRFSPFVLLAGTQHLTYAVNTMAKSCIRVRLSKNFIIL